MTDSTLAFDYHPEVVLARPIWELCRDASTPMAVKKVTVKYLPLAANHEGNAKDPRYLAFLSRAVFYGFTQETISGLLGLAFRQGVTAETDTATDYIKKNIDGDGIGIEQQSKAAMRSLIRYGRAGLFVDFPPTDGEVSKAQQKTLGLVATVNLYDAFSIVDWSTKHIGSTSSLSRVVLSEVQYRDKDGSTEAVDVKRTLRLGKEIDDNGEESGVELYSVLEEVDGEDDRIYQPRLANGSRLNYIPFYFVGATNNDASVDDAPIYPIADLNIAHYRNSADYENAAFLVSQPQPWASGLTQAWVDKNMGGFIMGSGLVSLPQGASFGIAQTSPNMVAMEAMLHKQSAMVMMGAKLISADMSFNTASEAIIASASENSRLQTLIDNTEMAYQMALKALSEFNGSALPGFTIDTDLSAVMADPQMAQVMVASFQSGLVAAKDVRDYMRKIGLVDRDDVEIEGEIEDVIVPVGGGL